MINAIKKSYNDNKGSAIITGLVVSTVLMVLCLSLLLVAYSQFVSTTRTSYDLTQREMLYSAAEALELELTDVGVVVEKDKDDNYRISGIVTGEDNTLGNFENRNLWEYIFENIISQDFESNTIWPYYDSNAEANSVHGINTASKYFNMTNLSTESEKIVVQLFWEKPKDYIGGENEILEGTVLNAIYKLYDNYSGDVLVKIERKYYLSGQFNNSDDSTQTQTDPSQEEVDNDDTFPGMIENPSIVNGSGLIYSLNGIEIYYYEADATNGNGLYENKICIKNNGSNDYNNWKFDLKYNGNISVDSNSDYSLSLKGDHLYSLIPTNQWYNINLKPGNQYWISLWCDVNDEIPSLRNTTEGSEQNENFSGSSNNIIGAGSYKLYDKDGISIVLNITWSNPNNYGGTVSLVNNSGKTLENWRLLLNTDDNLNISGNVKSKPISSGYIIENAVNNQDLKDGESFSASFQCEDNGCSNLPNAGLYIASRNLISRDDYNFEFKIIEAWTGGFRGELTIENKSGKSIEDWQLEFDFDGQLSFHELKIKTHEGSHYLVEHSSNSETNNILPGKSRTFTFNGNGNVPDYTDMFYNLYAFVFDESQFDFPQENSESTGNKFLKWNRIGYENLFPGGDLNADTNGQ